MILLFISEKIKYPCLWWLAYTFENPFSIILEPFLKEGMVFGYYGCGHGFFSLNVASLVGNNGGVFAYDIQQKMLGIMMARVCKFQLYHIISLILAIIFH